MMSAPTASEEEPNMVLNEELYSRQLYVLGAAAQRRLQKSKVLVSGRLSGLGAELCKNVVLAGVQSLDVHDDSPCELQDLTSAGFLISEANVAKGSPRAACFLEELRDMNANVAVQRIVGLPNFTSYDVVVMVNESRVTLMEVSGMLRDAGTRDTRFIATGAHGLLSYCFSDFGPSWEVTDADGEIIKSGLIIGASKHGPEHLDIQTESPHMLSDGDWVKLTCTELAGPFGISLVRGKDGKFDANLFRVTLETPDTILPSSMHAFDGAYFEQVKMPVVIDTHESFKRTFASPQFVNNSYEDSTKPARLLALLQSLWTFEESNGRLPQSGNDDDVEQLTTTLAGFSEDQRAELLAIAKVASGSLSPVTSFMGGVAGQEVLKACTGKFIPLNQWLLFAPTEILPCLPRQVRRSVKDDDDSALLSPLVKGQLSPFTLSSRGESPATLKGFSLDAQGERIKESAGVLGTWASRYDGQIRVFGHDGQKRLGALRIFIVGAGALGCEILKNLALMGVCTSSEGGMCYVTDPDSIEMSNLNRQFLFRPSTVGKNKAICAVEMVRKMNPHFAAIAYQERVSADSSGGPFTDKFWDSLDLVINALDNVPSRMFVDSQCVYYGKPLLESGTLGTKANTLPVVPHLTESYGSDSVKDFDATPEIPACTLHTFPHLFEHALTWARDAVFEKELASDPSEAKTFIDAYRQGQVAQLVQTMLRQPNSMAAKLRSARGVVVGIIPEDNADGIFPFTFAFHGSGSILSTASASSVDRVIFSLDDCVRFARLKFQELFVFKIELLLHQHPPDDKDGENNAFWSGKRRLPVPMAFDPEDSIHMAFVMSMAKLVARTHGLPNDKLIDAEMVKRILRNSPPVLSCMPKSSSSSTVKDGDWKLDVQRLEKVLSETPGLAIEPCRFEKDDDVHIDLVWSAASIRARNYKIPQMDRMEARRVVGRIIPAIATSTAAATGLVALELYKLILSPPAERKLDLFRAWNFNLAVNTYASFEPRPCAIMQEFDSTKWSLWSAITLKGDLTVDQLISSLGSHFRGFEVSSLTTTGEVTLYNDLFSMDDETVREAKVSDLYRRIVGKEPPEVFIPLTVDGDFDDDRYDDFVAPPVRLRWKEAV